MNGAVTIRDGKCDDLDRLVGLESVYSFTKPWTKDQFQKNFTECHARSLIAEIDGLIVGFLIYRKSRGTIVIDNIVVQGTYRKEGIGKRLINELKHQLDSSFMQILIIVQERNYAARGFLISAKFQCHAKRLWHYGKPTEGKEAESDTLTGLEFLFCANDPEAKRAITPGVIRPSVFNQRYE